MVHLLNKSQPNLRLRYKTLAIRLFGKYAMAFVPLGMCRAMSISGTLRLNKMNTLEPMLTDNREHLKVDGTLISAASGRVPLRSSILGARKKPWPLVVLLILIPSVAAAGFVHLIQTVPSGLIEQEFEGLGVALGAAACGGFLLWRVVHALNIDPGLQTQAPATSPSPLSPSEPNLAEPRRIQSSSPPDAATALAAPVASLPIGIRT
jgi:hypothetical protein